MEDNYITEAGKFTVEVVDCYLSKDDNEKYFIYLLFKTSDEKMISSRQYLGSEKQVEFVERTLKSAFGFTDRETIDSIIDKIDTIKGKKCRIVTEEKQFVDKNGDEKSTIGVKWINGLGPPRVETTDFKSRLRAIRSGKYSAPTKPTKPTQNVEDGGDEPF